MATGTSTTTAVTAIGEVDAGARYRHFGAFSRAVFRAKLDEEFRTKPLFRFADAGAIGAAEALLSRIERDGNVSDIRAMAYMFATAFAETRSFLRHAVSKKTRDGRRTTRLVTRWTIDAAKREVSLGRGRDYQLPVKVVVRADGSVLVTEQDGDQFVVRTDGTWRASTNSASRGAPASGPQSDVYRKAAGTERTYYGRGYVQLTWWNSYAEAGVAIGKGLALLLDPDLALDDEIAYAVMSCGMRTGRIFANGYSFDRYFRGSLTDYAGARAMVNGNDPRPDIVEAAEAFERVLLAAAVDPSGGSTRSASSR